MTPNNIVNMARLKGLDMIAVADHNTAGQLRAVKAVADAVGVSLLPAMELTTREEAHLLAYFLTVEEAEDFSREIYEFLPPIPNRVSLFGRQAFMNEDDEIVREEEKLLISALSLSVDALAVPAHINHGANGILNALGFLPPGLPFDAVEVAPELPLPEKGIPPLKRLHSSDAHYLENIFERTEFLDMSECSPRGFFDYIRSG